MTHPSKRTKESILTELAAERGLRSTAEYGQRKAKEAEQEAIRAVQEQQRKSEQWKLLLSVMLHRERLAAVLVDMGHFHTQDVNHRFERIQVVLEKHSTLLSLQHYVIVELTDTGRRA